MSRYLGLPLTCRALNYSHLLTGRASAAIITANYFADARGGQCQCIRRADYFILTLRLRRHYIVESHTISRCMTELSMATLTDKPSFFRTHVKSWGKVENVKSAFFLQIPFNYAL